MKMDIVESDLKQLFMWIKNLDERSAVLIKNGDGLDELCKSQQVLIEVQDERLTNIEHDLALVLSVIKDRKNST
tara:strand:- start:939 stop:1160 length:222 start_codon:yes stop_codon:yes gene_type:complete